MRPDARREAGDVNPPSEKTARRCTLEQYLVIKMLLKFSARIISFSAGMFSSHDSQVFSHVERNYSQALECDGIFLVKRRKKTFIARVVMGRRGLPPYTGFPLRYFELLISLPAWGVTE